MNILFGDTETTGIPDWKKPSEDPCQPHIVQLGAVLVDKDERLHIDKLDVIVRPDGWEITPELTEIHGITMEQAMDVGIPEEEALDRFLALYDRCSLRVFHNSTFDNRIIRIALKRYRPDLIPDDVWKNKDLYFCTLFNAKKIMGGSKGHTLGEAYTYFTGKTMENAHSALPDAIACMEIYFAMQEHLGEKLCQQEA